MKIPVLVLSMLFICGLTEAFAQKTSAGNVLIEKIKTYQEQFPQEKVHIHLDRPTYESGDTVRFAAYVVNAIKNIPSDLSHILYVDLFDAGNRRMVALKLRSVVGFSSGRFLLPDSLSGGVYQLRGYTSWMRNFDPEFFFTREFLVNNSIKKPGSALHTNQTNAGALKAGKDYKISFYPEGGHLLQGVSSMVGFKAVSQDGNGVDISATLKDESGNSILDFQSGNSGIGAFSITPGPGKAYHAVVRLPGGAEQRIKLPEVLESGCILTADNSDPDSLYIKIHSTADLLAREKMTFIPLTNGRPLFYMETTLPDQLVSLTIPKAKLPPGIIQLSLLNGSNQLVSERLVFNRYEDDLDMEISGLKSFYAPGENVDMSLLVRDRAGKPAVGSFSVSVIAAKFAPAADEHTIYTNLLLSSDLKDFVGPASYDLTEPAEQKAIALDNLMLTQRWSRFSWSKLTTETDAPEFELEQNIKVSGRILGDSKNTVVARVPITLLAGELGSGLLLDAETDDQGHFSFSLPDSLGYMPLRLQAKGKKGSGYQIRMDAEDLPAYHGPRRLEMPEQLSGAKKMTAHAETSVAEQDRIASAFSFQGVNRLKDVNIREFGKKKKIPDSHSWNLNGPGQADKTILPETLEKIPDLGRLDALLPIVYLGKADFRLRSAPPDMSHIPNILVLVDGVPGIMDIHEISPRDVESIEFMKDMTYAATYGIRGAGGVILITTKKGKFMPGGTTYAAPNTIFIPPIFSQRPEFYQRDSGACGVLKTIFWKPDVITDQTGRAKIQFKPIVNLKDCQVIIEGISSKGGLVRKVLRNLNSPAELSN